MKQLIKFTGGADSDSDVRYIKAGDYRACVHLRNGTIEAQNEFTKETYAGNLIVNNSGLPAGTNIVLNAIANEENGTILFWVYNSVGTHTIWLYNIASAAFTKVLQGGPLNYTATEFFYNGKVVNGLLYWSTGRFSSYISNNFNPPQKINISKAIAFTLGLPGGYTAVNFQTLDMIKYPPVFGPVAAYVTDTNQEANFLYGKMHKFRYRYYYDDYEHSVFSPVSNLPLPQNSDFVQGRNWSQTQGDNKLEITVQTGPDIVTKIEVAVQFNDGTWYIFKTIDKAFESIANNTTYVVDFYGNEALQSLGVLENYDGLPQIAQCMEFIEPTREMVFGNFIEGYDQVDLSATIESFPVEIESLDFIPPNLRLLYDSNPISPTYGSSLQVKYGTATFGITSVFYAVGDTYNFQVFDSGGPDVVTATYVLTAQDVVDIAAAADPRDELADILGTFVSGIYGTPGAVTAGTGIYSWPALEVFELPQISNNLYGGSFSIYRKDNPNMGLFKGAVHEFAVQYYDRANRDGSVLAKETLNLYVPSEVEQDKTDFFLTYSPFYSRARIQISSTPPDWATNYQILHRRIPVTSFEYRTGIKIESDPAVPSGYKISLDPYWTNVQGAKYNHSIQAGDVVRLIRISATNGPTARYGDYCTTYAELQVLSYDPVGGTTNFGYTCESITVPQFDYSGVLDGTTGFLLQIYTPAKKDENAPWREISEEFTILNANTANRAHTGSSITGTASNLVTGSNLFELTADLINETAGADLSYLVNRTFSITADVPWLGVITNVAFNPATQINVITASTNFTGVNTNGSIVISLNQVGGGTPLSAVLNLGYGDVYTRIRQMSTGYASGGVTTGYYYIDDFYYSDYYDSNVNPVGRFGFEVPDARRVLQKATIIHGGSYVDNTLSNNLSTFSLSNLTNRIAMDESVGSINKLVMIGYTLKALQDRKENSVYIQRIITTTGSTPLTPSTNTFNQNGWEPYRGTSFGTIHPGSVQLIFGSIFYYDFYSGTVVRTSNNGQTDLCAGDYMYNSRINDFKTRFLASSGSANNIITSYSDERNGEYALFAVNKTTGAFVDGITFSLNRDRWDHELLYAPIVTCKLGQTLVSFPGPTANLYVHNVGAQNSFYGVVRQSSIKYAFNINPDLIKVLLSMGIMSNQGWTVSAVDIPANANYAAMSSQIPAALFEALEGYYWSNFLRDQNNVVVQIPYLATTTLALYNGREMRGYAAEITMTYTPGSRCVLNGVVINPTESRPVNAIID